MAVEIRAITQEELTHFRKITSYVFSDNESDPTDAATSLVAPDWTTCAFVDGALASVLAAYPFRMRWNGTAADVAGLTAVGTLPQHRRRGLLRRTITQSFREQRERGQSLAILWASYGGIYQRFGYGPASNTASYTFDPRWAGLHPGLESPGSVSLFLADERDDVLPKCKEVYKAYSAPRNLMLHRAAPTWNFGVYGAFDKQKRAYTALYRDPSGAAAGYVVYQLEALERDTPNQRLIVRDFIALDIDAHVGLWQHLLAHDLVFEVRMDAVAEDDPSPLLVEESRKLERRVSDGLYLRVVDAERALALRPYHVDAEPAGRLSIEVSRDEACDWNEGVFELEWEAGEARVTRGAAVPDLVVPPRSLASLVSGHTGATQLARARLLDARDPSVLERADRLFATAYRPFCPDGF